VSEQKPHREAERKRLREELDKVDPLFGLPDLLSELMDLDRWAPHLWEGREHRILAADPLVGRLTAAMKDPGADEILESTLNTLFADLREGESFEHSEVVMALLFAMKAARSRLFLELTEALSQSEAAELGQLRRFAKRLLTKG
jgi:hypothetical protein